MAGGLCLSAGVAAWIRLPLPAALLGPPNVDGLVLLDRSGELLRSTRVGDGNRQRWVPIGDLDPDLLIAFVAAEDRRFYQHHGVDWRALGRAIRQNLAAGRVVSGASTITMQLARLAIPMPRNWLGKGRQALWALRIDRHLSKQEVLEQYLNRIPLGEAALGVEAAARLYFGVSARDLTLGQAATLAGLASSPSRGNPLRRADRAAARRNVVLARIRRAGNESEAVLARAAAEPVEALSTRAAFTAPHFTSWVLSRGESLRGTVSTSLDAGLQREIEGEVRHTATELRRYGAEHAAAVVLDNHSGEILAWVGSPDFRAADGGQVDMVVSPRQPGSALKPFLYGLAFDKGFTPASILADVATVYPTSTGPYAPRNYDRRYRGPVRAREALGSSFNIPAVELASRLGVPTLLELLQRAGFRSLRSSPERYGLGLALGNGEVTLLELANGYRALAQGGRWRPIRWRAAGPGDGAGPATQVLSPEAAAQVLDVLADPAARLAGFGANTPLEFPFRAAAKTGTSRHFTDNWAVATTGRFTVAVWVGNFSGRPMDGVSGITGAGPLLHRVVLMTARRYPPGDLVTPHDAGLVARQVCRLSGLLATSGCPAYPEWFRLETVVAGDTWFGPTGVTLPPEYVEWSNRSASGNAVAGAGIIKAGGDSARAGFRITSLRDGDRFRFVPGVDPAFATVALRAAGQGTHRVRWFVDGLPIGSARWQLAVGRHHIDAVAGPAADRVTVDVLP